MGALLAFENEIRVILRHTFAPPNNTRLGHLCGPLDAHLRAHRGGAQRQDRAPPRAVQDRRPQGQRAARAWRCCRRCTRSPSGRSTPPSCSSCWPATARWREAEDGAHDARHAPHRPARAHAQPERLPATTSPTTTSRFGIGPAGTGKTYLAVACAVDALERSAVQRIVLTRPAVEAGERLGFLPGDLTQKVDPYLRPLYDALYDLMGFDRVQKAFERNALEIAPLAFMRGRTLNNAFVILDEAQNTTPEQMKMFLTRIGFGAKAVVTGDVSQIDLPQGAAERPGRCRARAQARERHRHHALHQRRRGAPSAGGAHRRRLRRRAQAQRRRAEMALAAAARCRCSSRASSDVARHRAALPRHRVARWIRHALRRRRRDHGAHRRRRRRPARSTASSAARTTRPTC